MALVGTAFSIASSRERNNQKQKKNKHRQIATSSHWKMSKTIISQLIVVRLEIMTQTEFQTNTQTNTQTEGQME